MTSKIPYKKINLIYLLNFFIFAFTFAKLRLQYSTSNSFEINWLLFLIGQISINILIAIIAAFVWLVSRDADILKVAGRCLVSILFVLVVGFPLCFVGSN